MKFSSREDIKASAEAVFAALCDHAEFQQQMRRSGVSVVRMDELSEIGPGMSWEIDFKFRGREHKFFSQVQELKPQQPMLISNESYGLSGDVVVDVVALAPKRARLMLSVELKPKNLSAWLLLQSMRFAKNSLDRKFEARIRDLATNIETVHHASM